MTARSPLALAIIAALAPASPAQTPATGNAVWPQATYQQQLPADFRFIAAAELKEGTNYDHQEWILGGEIAYQWQRIAGRHAKNIDSDKEHHLVLGLGYEYLQTDQPQPATFENRVILDATLRTRPSEPLLLSDRNRYEYRWVDGDYSTRYRNLAEATLDLTSKERPVRAYVSAEFFYEVQKALWNEQQYAAGVQWPAGKRAVISTYYLFQFCTTCTPRDVNVLGVTFSGYGLWR